MSEQNKQLLNDDMLDKVAGGEQQANPGDVTYSNYKSVQKENTNEASLLRAVASALNKGIK